MLCRTLTNSLMAMQVAGSDWKLVQEGQSAEANQEPQFSTWEDVVNKKKAQKSNEASQSSSDSQSASAQESASSSNPASTGRRRGRVFDDTYYRYVNSLLKTDISGRHRKPPIQGMCAGVPGAPTYICLATTVISAWHVVVYMVSVRMKSPLENACIRRPGMQSQV